jgi:hypothetical protein
LLMVGNLLNKGLGWVFIVGNLFNKAL